MSSVKVLFIAHLHHIGGVQTRLLDFLAEPAPGFKFYVYSPKVILRLWKEKLKQLQIPYQDGGGKTGWERDLAFYAKKYQIDVAHFHQPWTKAMSELKKVDIKVIIEHDHGSVCGALSRIEKHRSNKDLVDGVITVSNAGRLLLTQLLGYNSSMITIIYDGVNFKLLKVTKPAPHPHDKKIVTTICRLDFLKGVDSLLKAVPIVLDNRKDVEFWIIGDGPRHGELKDLAKNLSINNYVKFWGLQENVGNFLASTDLFVLPSTREALGGVLIEAGYFGIPSIAANVDGIPEVLIDGKTGILIDPTVPFDDLTQEGFDPSTYMVVDGKTKQLRRPLLINPDTLGLKIIKLLKHPERCQRMGNMAREHVLKIFNIDRYRQELTRYYYEKLREKEKIL